ncbi:V-type ATP synthase subunit E [Oscillospiraceae bacterium PP1C4]
MTQTPNDKLELFEQEIMRKAAAQKEEILKDAEEMKRAELDKEDNRLLEELYHKIQEQILEVRTGNIKEISRETLALKKQLFQQREQHLIEMLARARGELAAFVKSDAYETYLMNRIETFVSEYKLDGSVIKVRTADLPYADKIKERYGDCTVEADDTDITIGGAILLNKGRGIEVDLSLDAALAEQRDWFYNNSKFNFE